MSEPITIETRRGPVEALWDEVGAPSVGVVLMVGGADGGFEGPAEAIYPALVEDFGAAGVSSLRVDFRIKKFPNDVDEGVYDVGAALGWLRERDVTRVVLVGHSFGGAVVIDAGARSPLAAGVVTLATQTAGALRVSELAPRPILLVHGTDDVRLPPRCSEMLYEMAGEPRDLVLIEGATHSLRQAREQVRDLVRSFALRVFGGATPPPA
jgi:alpha/beta superfamily hydrolase